MENKLELIKLIIEKSSSISVLSDSRLLLYIRCEIESKTYIISLHNDKNRIIVGSYLSSEHPIINLIEEENIDIDSYCEKLLLLIADNMQNIKDIDYVIIQSFPLLQSAFIQNELKYLSNLK